MVARLEGSCRWFKVGLELFCGAGVGLVTELREMGFGVFLDLKLHDIPNTVAGAVRAHRGGGRFPADGACKRGAAMMEAARAAVRSSELRLLGVTVLTSMDGEQMAGAGVPGTTAEQVLRLARLARKAGMDGMVCSAEEVGELRLTLGEEPLLVVPGIRPAGAEVGDQRRVAGPREALRRGASMLVVGRPITQAKDPLEAAMRILEEMAG